METRASYLLVGSFTLFFLAVLFVLVVWLARLELGRDTDIYHVFFHGAVTGLQAGSPVRYRGIPVGTVSDVRLDPDNVERVRVTIAVPAGTPVKRDAVASLELQGLTGAAFVQIEGGTQASPDLTAPAGGVPEIPSKPSAIAQVVDAAPQLLDRMVQISSRLEAMLSPENERALGEILANINTLTATLAQSTQALSGAGAEVQTTLANLNGLVRSLDGASAQLTGLIAENREPLRDFTGTGLYEFTSLVVQMRELTTTLTRVSERIERSPADFFLGSQRGGVEVPR